MPPSACKATPPTPRPPRHDDIEPPIGGPAVHATLEHVGEVEVVGLVDARSLHQAVTPRQHLHTSHRLSLTDDLGAAPTATATALIGHSRHSLASDYRRYQIVSMELPAPDLSSAAV